MPRGERANPVLDFMGTTANMCYIHRKSGKFFIANLGDSMSMQFSSGGEGKGPKVRVLSKCHELSDPVEQERIVKAGFLL